VYARLKGSSKLPFGLQFCKNQFDSFVHLGSRCLPVRTSGFVIGCALFFLQGCASAPPAVVALANALGPALTGGPGALPSQAQLNPALTYLYVQAPGQSPVFFVLGYVEPAAHESGPATLVWFSAMREVLRTQNGRLVGLTGVPQGKTALSWKPPAPAWADLLVQTPPTTVAVAPRATTSPAAVGTLAPPNFVRTWDEPARYRFGRTDRVSLHPQRWSDLPNTVLRLLRGPLAGADYTNWNWFVQRSDREPQAWFALAPVAGVKQVVYSFQCLDADTCFHIAPWPLGQVALP